MKPIRNQTLVFQIMYITATFTAKCDYLTTHPFSSLGYLRDNMASLLSHLSALFTQTHIDTHTHAQTVHKLITAISYSTMGLSQEHTGKMNCDATPSVNNLSSLILSSARNVF